LAEIGLIAVDTAIVSALISAVVAFLVIALKELVLEPRRKRREDEQLRRELISVWLSDMESNVSTLKDSHRRLDRLVYDDRPLDRIASYRPDLAKTMTEVRCRIKDLNELLELYDAVGSPTSLSSYARPSQS